MMHKDNFLTPVEQHLDLDGTRVSDADFKPMREVFDSLPSTAFKMCEDDLEELQKLLPNIDCSQLAGSEVKPANGLCRKCGRAMNLLDIVHSALKTGKHSSGFVERILSGDAGTLVIVGYRPPNDLSEDVKKKLPPNTIYVKDAAPIPCKNCGIKQELVLYMEGLMRFWVSDVHSKENIGDIDRPQVLDRLTRIPISIWNYKTDKPNVRHIGPMAQDFFAAFGFGNDDTKIAAMDATGVALAAIQELHTAVIARDREIAMLTSRLAAVENAVLDPVAP